MLQEVVPQARSDASTAVLGGDIHWFDDCVVVVMVGDVERQMTYDEVLVERVQVEAVRWQWEPVEPPNIIGVGVLSEEPQFTFVEEVTVANLEGPEVKGCNLVGPRVVQVGILPPDH